VVQESAYRMLNNSKEAYEEMVRKEVAKYPQSMLQ
jgi:hypothetical protein